MPKPQVCQTPEGISDESAIQDDSPSATPLTPVKLATEPGFPKSHFPAEPAAAARGCSSGPQRIAEGERQLATNAPIPQPVAPCRLRGVAGHRILQVPPGGSTRSDGRSGMVLARYWRRRPDRSPVAAG